MASGEVHVQYLRDYLKYMLTASMFIAVFGIATIDIATVRFGLALFAGYMLSFWFEPDLDQIGITRSEAMFIKYVVTIPIVAWSSLYARIMQVLGGHRSFWSHFPFISTFIRMCWFGVWVVALLWFTGILPDPRAIDVAFGVWVGMSVGDTIHYILDYS